MKLPIAFLLLALPLVAQGDARWVHDLDSALRRAQGERKQVFVDVWTEWCGPCQYLQKSIFPTSEASAALAKVVPASLMVQSKDGKDLPGGRAILEKFRVNAFPTLLLLDANGKELRRKVGIFRSGQELAAWIAGADGPPRVGSGDRQLRPFTPGRPTEADQIRSAGARQYETELARISRTADQLETAFSSFLERQWDGKVRGHFDRSFYALWEDGALQGRPVPGAEFRFSDLRRRAESLRGILRLAEEQARRADVFPGDRRDLRARYRLEHRGWE